MTKVSKSAAVGVIMCAGLSAASAEELRFDRLHIIGDSLSDGGTYSQAVRAGSGFTVPDIRYRWLTNAPDGSSLTYGEVLGRALGINLQPNVISAVGPFPAIAVGGTNYAEGGSRVALQPGIGNNPANGITTLPLSTQVDRMLAATPTLNSNDLVILWGGANDVFFQSGAVGLGLPPATAAANMAQAAIDLVAQVDRVKAAGAQTVIVVTVPDIGTTPFGASQGPLGAGLLTGLSNAFNAQLATSLGGKAVIVDAGKLLGAIQTNPVAYGFTAPGAATIPACGVMQSLTCIQGAPGVLADSELRVFADGVHPTTRAHAVFGQAAFAGLQAATQTGAIAVATMTALRQQNLSIENRMNPTAMFYTDENGQRMRRAVGEFDFFASVEAGSYKSAAQQVTPGLRGATRVAKLGFDVAVLPNATIGAGISFDKGKVTFDGNRGGFDSDLIVGAVFGQIALTPTYYVNAAIGGGTIDVKDITRSFALGAATETYRATTSGSYRFARIGGGAMFPVSDQVLLNPYVNYTQEKVSIKGFTESAGAASLSFGNSNYTARRITLGLSATFSPTAAPDWKFNLRGSIEHDLSKDPLFVSLGPTAATLGAVSAPRPDRTWGYISATAVREFGRGSFVNFGVSASVGQSGTVGYVGAIGFKTTF